MNKKIISLTILLMLGLAACGPRRKQSTLKTLRLLTTAVMEAARPK